MRLPCAAACLLAACATQSPSVEVRHQIGLRAPEEPRLGWVTWADDETLVGCSRRIDDEGNPVGVLGPCKKVGPDGVVRPLVSWLNAEAPDRSPLGFRVEPSRRPDEAPARLWAGKMLIEAWTPEKELTADEYRVEATRSPAGKWLGLVHLAIGIGEGQRTIEVTGLRLIPAADAPRG
jgi:hypothetical protein